MIEYMLTTIDNPFDPFTQYREWYQWDVQSGYHSVSLLGRIVRTSNELSDVDQLLAVQDAINEIVLENVSGAHTKIAASAAVA